jgi:hypothetical protein
LKTENVLMMKWLLSDLKLKPACFTAEEFSFLLLGQDFHIASTLWTYDFFDRLAAGGELLGLNTVDFLAAARAGETAQRLTEAYFVDRAAIRTLYGNIRRYRYGGRAWFFG